MLSFEETLDLYKIMNLYDDAYERLPDTEIINRSFEKEPSEFEGILKSKLDKSADGVMNKTNTVIREKNGRRSILEVKERNSSMSNVMQLLDRGIPESTNCPSGKESSPESRNNEEINECSSMLNSCHNGLSRERLHEKSVSDVSILQDYPFLDGFEKTSKLSNCNLMEGVLLTLSSIVNGRINTNPVRFLFNEEQCRSNRDVNKLQLRLAMNIMKQEILKNGLNGKEGLPHLSKGFYYDTVTQTTTAFVMVTLGQGNSTKLLEILMKYVEAYESVTQKKQNEVESSIEDLAQQREVNLASCVIKTRSGRAVRTPKHITRNFVEVNSKKCDNDVNAVMQDVPVEPVPVQQLELPTFKRTYSERCRCPTCNKIYLGDKRMNAHFKKFPEHNNKTILPKIPELPSAPVITSSSRNRDPRFQCTTCSKIYLGYQRMKKHFGKFPDHTNNELLTKIRQGTLKSKSITSNLRNVDVKYAVDRKKRRTRAHDISKEQLENNSETSDLNTWEYMLALVKKKKTEDESFSSTLLREMEFLLKQTRQFSRKIVKPAHAKDIICNNETIEVSEDDPWRYVLGIKPGTYLLVNDDDMESQTDELSLDNELDIANKIGIETLNEALKLFEDNTLQDFVLPGNEFNRNVDEISNSSFPLDFDDFSLSMDENMNDDISSNLGDLLL